MATAPPPDVSEHYHPECEAAINYQISLELYASYVYESLASYFSSHAVAFRPFSQFFLQQSSQERQHAQRLMWLQNQRSGHLSLRNISRPDTRCWENALTAMECTLHLKMTVNQSLVDLYEVATEKKDDHLCDFLNSHYLSEQMKFIKELEDHISNLRKMEAEESGLAEELRAKLTLHDSDKY